MKYTVLIALFGAVSARHHHHHQSLAQKEGGSTQPATPFGNSNASFVPGKAAAAAVVANQLSFQAKSDAAVAAANAKATQECDTLKDHVTKARVDQIDNEVYQNPYFTRSQWTQRPPPALMQLEDNEADVAFLAGKKVATKVVADQVSYQAKSDADVAAAQAKYAAETKAKNTATEVNHHTLMKEFRYHLVFIPEENVTLQMY